MANKKSPRKDRGAVPIVAYKANPSGRPDNVAGGKTNPGVQKGAASKSPAGRSGR